jgi:hypothetical protein
LVCLLTLVPSGLTGVNGDSDGAYLVVVKGIINAAQDTRIVIQPNGDSGTNYIGTFHNDVQTPGARRIGLRPAPNSTIRFMAAITRSIAESAQTQNETGTIARSRLTDFNSNRERWMVEKKVPEGFGKTAWTTSHP